MKIVWLSLLCSTSVIAAEWQISPNWRLLQPNDVHIDAYKNEVVRDPYLSPIDRDLSYGAGFNVDLDIIKYKGLGLYWNNLLHFDQSDKTGQIKAAGWQYEAGFTVLRVNELDKIQFFHQHHSQHILEEKRPTHFPIMDRYGIRLRIYP
jgi:hypothetical protein